MKYEVWREGFRITGCWSNASLVGECEANSFAEACEKLLGRSSTFNRERLSDWGCKLYDNEKDARQSFG